MREETPHRADDYGRLLIAASSPCVGPFLLPRQKQEALSTTTMEEEEEAVWRMGAVHKVMYWGSAGSSVLFF